MATTTTNYGFDVPTSSDLVKNGATAISTLGQDIDTFLFRPFSKNAVINGAMDIWQRSTSSTSNGTYNSVDRWWNYSNAGTTTWSRESTIVPTGSLYSMKIAQAGSTSTNTQMNQAIETLNAVQFAGKTVSLSAQFCASASTNVYIGLSYSTSTDVAPTGSWTGITASGGTTNATSATTASFTQLSAQYVIPSTAKSLLVVVGSSSVAAGTNVYVGQVQLETGSQSTPFTRNAGTIQGELAACQRYYWRQTAQTAYTVFSSAGFGTGTTTSKFQIKTPVSMRVVPTSIDYSTLAAWDGGSTTTISTLSLEYSHFDTIGIAAIYASGITQYRPYSLISQNSTSAYIGFSAEL